MPHVDPEVRRTYDRAYRIRAFDAQKQGAAAYRQRPEVKARNIQRAAVRNEMIKRQIDALIDAFRANGCEYCDEKEPVALDAHHIDPTTKEFGIAKSYRISPRRMEAELKKCICLCSNCHRKLHAGLIA